MAANSEATAKKRRGPGKPFKKGQSGNPSGRPKIPDEFKELAKSTSVEALRTVIEIMQTAPNEQSRLRAAEIIMDRAWGKATAPIDLDMDSSVSIEIKVID